MSNFYRLHGRNSDINRTEFNIGYVNSEDYEYLKNIKQGFSDYSLKESSAEEVKDLRRLTKEDNWTLKKFMYMEKGIDEVENVWFLSSHQTDYHFYLVSSVDEKVTQQNLEKWHHYTSGRLSSRVFQLYFFRELALDISKEHMMSMKDFYDKRSDDICNKIIDAHNNYGSPGEFIVSKLMPKWIKEIDPENYNNTAEDAKRDGREKIISTRVFEVPADDNEFGDRSYISKKIEKGYTTDGTNFIHEDDYPKSLSYYLPVASRESLNNPGTTAS